MLKISAELRDCIIEANRKIKKRYIDMMIKDKEIIRRMINLRINKIRHITTYNDKLLGKFGERGIVAVDGSICLNGTSYPHYISIMQAKAKSTNKSANEIIKAEIHAPLLEDYDRIENEEDIIQEKDEKTCSNKLALLELQTASEALEKMEPSLIMIDGPLTRVYNSSREKWKEFVQSAIEKDTVLVGIIEEIKTSETVKRFKGIIHEKQEKMHDRELLFGALEKGEMFILNDWEVGGIRKCFIRTSLDPHVICIEYLKEQEDIIEEILAVLLALTPEDGRGIPIWLDIVDSEVRITEKMAKILIETYIDSEIRHRMINAKRD